MPVLKQGESTFTPVPPGTHPARCYAMISLGTQPPGNPKFKPSFQVLLSFELPNEQIEIDGEKKPMVISKFLNAYLGSSKKPSQTRQFIEAWRGRPFTETELKGFDLANVVGAPCLLNVIHYTKADGNTDAKVASISPLAKGMSMSGIINTKIIYEIEDKENDVFKAFPDWIKEKIAKCDEWQHPLPAPTQSEPEPEPDDNDSVPF